MAKDPQVIGRFKREAQASSLLRAPHTVQVYDFDQTPEGIMFLAMEILQGKSLHSILRDEGAFDPVRWAKVMDGVADSLGEAHAQGIVHRDIKPENIYLEPRPTPDFAKVLDFGIAKIVSGDGLAASGPALTAAGQTLGTLEYMSPEQLMGAQLDGRSDLYALGIMSYEMLIGQLPFPAKTPGEMITAHLKTVPPPASKMNPKVPPLMDQILSRLVEKNRDKRYKDTAELRVDLKRVIDGERGEKGTPAAAPSPAPVAKPQAIAKPQPSRHVENTEQVDLDTPAGSGLSGKLIAIIAGVVVAVAAIVVALIAFTAKK
jgi:serine/threonine-protein kinase